MTTATQLDAKENDVQNTWDKFLDLIKSRVSINTFNTWFQPTRLSRGEGDTLFVQIPSAVFRQVLTRTYGEIVKAVFHQMGTPNTKVQYVCTEEEPVQAAPALSGAKQSKLDFESSDHQLNTRYTFDSFVVGKSNEFAHAASRAVAEQPSKSYNPLFLYGGVGMGKTHLMHAIGHTIKKRNPAMRLSYVSAEKFTIEVINSLALRSHDQLPRPFPYRRCSARGRYSVHRRKRTHPGRVLSYLQRSVRTAETDRDFFRLPAQRHQFD